MAMGVIQKQLQLLASKCGATVDADLGGSSKYSKENFEGQSWKGFHVNSSWYIYISTMYLTICLEFYMKHDSSSKKKKYI